MTVTHKWNPEKEKRGCGEQQGSSKGDLPAVLKELIVGLCDNGDEEEGIYCGSCSSCTSIFKAFIALRDAGWHSERDCEERARSLSKLGEKLDQQMLKQGWHAPDQCPNAQDSADKIIKRLETDSIPVPEGLKLAGYVSPEEVKKKVQELKDVWRVALAERWGSDSYDKLEECTREWFKTIDNVFGRGKE